MPRKRIVVRAMFYLEDYQRLEEALRQARSLNDYRRIKGCLLALRLKLRHIRAFPRKHRIDPSMFPEWPASLD